MTPSDARAKAVEPVARELAQYIQAFPYDSLPRDRAHARECEREGCTPASETQASICEIAQAAIKRYEATLVENGYRLVRDDFVGTLQHLLRQINECGDIAFRGKDGRVMWFIPDPPAAPKEPGDG